VSHASPRSPAHENPDDDALRALLVQARTIAVVGASSKATRPSHGVFQRLLGAGYRVIPVNPHEQEVLGQRAFPTLEAIGAPVDIVDVFRRASETVPVAESAVRVGARALWLQSGVVNEEAARLARAAGLVVVMDACIAVVHSLLQIPRK